MTIFRSLGRGRVLKRRANETADDFGMTVGTLRNQTRVSNEVLRRHKAEISNLNARIAAIEAQIKDAPREIAAVVGEVINKAARDGRRR